VSGRRPGARLGYGGLAAYVVLVGTLFTPLYEAFTTGRDDSWAILIVLLGAHVGLGAAVARPWVLVLPVALAVAGFVASGAEGLAALGLLVGIPLGIMATGLGWVAAAVLRHRAAAVAIGAFACALVPVAWATVETVRHETAPHLPAALQAQLPTSGSPDILCVPEAPRAERARTRRQLEVLIRELRRHRHWLVTVEYTLADEPGVERKDLTVRELAEEQLQLLDGTNCAQELRRRIRNALD
jgi:hypothetical protein